MVAFVPTPQTTGRFLQLPLCHLELKGLIRTSPVQSVHVVRVLTLFRGSVTPYGFENIFRRLELLSKLRQHDHRLRKYQFSPGKNLNPLLDKILSILYYYYIARSKPYYYRIQIGNPEVTQMGKLAMLHINN